MSIGKSLSEDEDDHGWGPLDVAASAFAQLVTGPHPVSVRGDLFPGLPDREIPVDELRYRLLRRQCRQVTRDAVWAHAVLRSRTQGGAWTVACVGLAIPALLNTCAWVTQRFAGDPDDIHAAVLAGFLEELARIDLTRPRILVRLRWAAYRAGHRSVRHALDAPVPIRNLSAVPQPPPRPWRHPDLILAGAVAEKVITGREADLISATRLQGCSLSGAAHCRQASYEATKKSRQRAEARLVAYLRAQPAADITSVMSPDGSHVGV